MDYHLLDDVYLSQAKETTLAEIELLILLLLIPSVLFIPLVDRQKYPLYTKLVNVY